MIRLECISSSKKDNRINKSYNSNKSSQLPKSVTYVTVSFGAKMYGKNYISQYCIDKKTDLSKVSEDARFFVDKVENFFRLAHSSDTKATAKTNEGLYDTFQGLLLRLLNNSNENNQHDLTFIYSSLLELLDKSNNNNASSKIYSLFSDFSESFSDKECITKVKEFYLNNKLIQRPELSLYIQRH